MNVNKTYGSVPKKTGTKIYGRREGGRIDDFQDICNKLLSIL